MRKIILLPIIGCLILIAKIYWPNPTKALTSSPNEVKTTTFIQNKIKDNPNLVLKHNWPTNEEIAYSMAWSIKQDGSTAQPGTLIKANWHFKILEVQNDTVLIATQLDHVILDDGAANDYSSLVTMLEKEVVYILYSLSGELKNVYWSKEIALKDSMTLRQINSVEVALPDKSKITAPGNQWKHIEPSINGDAEILYTFFSETNLSKETLSYDSNNGQDMGFELEVDDSLYTIVLGNVWLNEYKGAETFTISNDQNVLSSITSSLNLTRLLPLKTKLLSAFDAKGFYAIRDQKLTNKLDMGNVRDGAWDEVQQKKISEAYKGVPLNQVITDLRDAIKHAKNHQETVSATNELANWIQANESNPGELVDLLKTQNLTSGETARMVHALELASNSPEAQVALAKLFTDPSLPDLLREQALVAAGGVKPPAAPGLIDSLVDAALSTDMDLGNTPLLNLGVLANSDKFAAIALEQHFGSMLSLGSDIDPARLSTVIDAFTNSGLSSDIYISSIQEILLTQESADLKVAATEYLSAVANSPAENFLTTLSDSNTEVQIAGVKAMFNVSPTEGAANSLAHANLESTSDRVRLEILSQLKDHKGLEQQYVSDIKSINNVTDSENVQLAIQELLTN